MTNAHCTPNLESCHMNSNRKVCVAEKIAAAVAACRSTAMVIFVRSRHASCANGQKICLALPCFRSALFGRADISSGIVPAIYILTAISLASVCQTPRDALQLRLKLTAVHTLTIPLFATLRFTHALRTFNRLATLVTNVGKKPGLDTQREAKSQLGHLSKSMRNRRKR